MAALADVTTWLGSVEETAPAGQLSDPNTRENQDERRRGSSSPTAPLMNPLAVDAGNYITDNHGKFGKRHPISGLSTG